MTLKVFWKNPYQIHLESEVASVTGEVITLKATIFYAFSGGQEGDSGTIGGYPVINAHKTGKEIYYTLPENHGLTAGARVTVEIDWDRRYKIMRLHFAAELMLELITRKLAGSQKIGAHISAEKARIDFEWPESISDILPEINDQAKKIIDANSPIVSAYSDVQAERRYWQVEGFAKVDCGGTHLKRTGEVGEVELKRKNIGRGKERVEIYLK